MDAAFRWIFSGMFALVPGIFFAIGLSESLDQVRRYANPASTQGTIVAPDEGRVYAPGETTSAPPIPQPFDPTDSLIRFRYAVDGKTYYTEQSLFFQRASGSAPVYSLGQSVTVYYRSAAPYDAWLMAELDSMPFMMMLFVTPFWTIAAGVFFLAKPTKPAAAAPPVGNGWHQLSVRSTRSDKLFSSWMLLIVGTIPGIGIYLHTRVAPPWHTLEMGVATALYSLYILAMLAHVLYRVATLRAGHEAIVLINAPVATVGQPLAIRVEHDLRRTIPQGTLEVGLHCRRDDKTTGGGKTQYTTETSHDLWLLSRDIANLPMGQPAVCEGQLDLPTDARPSRTPGDTAYPRYSWSVQVRTRLPGADYNAKFSLLVAPGTTHIEGTQVEGTQLEAAQVEGAHDDSASTEATDAGPTGSDDADPYAPPQR